MLKRNKHLGKMGTWLARGHVTRLAQGISKDSSSTSGLLVFPLVEALATFLNHFPFYF